MNEVYLCANCHGASDSPSRGTEAGVASVNAGEIITRLVRLAIVLTALK